MTKLPIAHVLINGFSAMLYIDIGNSTIKVASFSEGNWNLEIRVPLDQLSDAIMWCKGQMSTHRGFLAASVVSSVRLSMEDALGTAIRFVDVDSFPADKIDYSTPRTLGIDRVLACLGAWSISRSAVIVVDAGTATTIDYMSYNGVFEGGVIAPGIGIIEHALNTYAPALPVVEREVPESWPPKSTGEAVQWGITGSYKAMIYSHIQRFLTRDPDAIVWVCGGDASILLHLESMDTRYHPNLVLEGLRYMDGFSATKQAWHK